MESEVFNWKKWWWYTETYMGWQLARAAKRYLKNLCSWGVLLCFGFFFSREKLMISLPFAHGLVVLADFPPTPSHNWDNTSMKNTMSCRKLMPQTFYVRVAHVRFLSGGAVAYFWDVCPVYLVVGRTSPTRLAFPLLQGSHQLCLCPSFRLVSLRCTSWRTSILNRLYSTAVTHPVPS